MHVERTRSVDLPDPSVVENDLWPEGVETNLSPRELIEPHAR